MNTEKFLVKGVKRHYNGQEVLFEVESLQEHYEGLEIHDVDKISLNEVDYVRANDVNIDNAVEKEVLPEMKAPSGMTYEEAELLMAQGECIALPEWEGFWFRNIKTTETLVLTKEGEITNTPLDEFKERKDWITVIPNETQNQLIKDYFESLEQNREFDKEPLSYAPKTKIESQQLKADYVEVPADAVEEVKKEEEVNIPAELPKEEIAAPVAETPAPKAKKSTTKK